MLLVFAVLAAAQSPQLDSIERQRAAIGSMSASLERQKESVRRQQSGATPTAAQEGFFTVNWPRPPSFAPPDREREEPAPDDCPPLPAGEARELAQRGEAATGVPARLIGEVMRQESGFDPCAVSRAGALGLMQLMPGTASDLGLEDPFDPLANVLAGSRFLRQMLDRYRGDLARALGAYNAGPGRVDAFGGVPPFAETKKYVGDILNRLRE
jgi:hypothetical protein